jgi:hypothetical protein
MPWRMTSVRCNRITPPNINGSTSTCSAKNRASVAAPSCPPPRSNFTAAEPTMGVVPAMFVPTCVAQ